MDIEAIFCQIDDFCQHCEAKADALAHADIMIPIFLRRTHVFYSLKSFVSLR
jgi:hypothetical protein